MYRTSVTLTKCFVAALADGDFPDLNAESYLLSNLAVTHCCNFQPCGFMHTS